MLEANIFLAAQNIFLQFGDISRRIHAMERAAIESKVPWKNGRHPWVSTGIFFYGG
jgi:hypothetical protein